MFYCKKKRKNRPPVLSVWMVFLHIQFCTLDHQYHSISYHHRHPKKHIFCFHMSDTRDFQIAHLQDKMCAIRQALDRSSATGHDEAAAVDRSPRLGCTNLRSSTEIHSISEVECQSFIWVTDKIRYMAKGGVGPPRFCSGGTLYKPSWGYRFRVGPYRFCSNGNPTTLSILRVIPSFVRYSFLLLFLPLYLWIHKIQATNHLHITPQHFNTCMQQHRTPTNDLAWPSGIGAHLKCSKLSAAVLYTTTKTFQISLLNICWKNPVSRKFQTLNPSELVSKKLHFFDVSLTIFFHEESYDVIRCHTFDYLKYQWKISKIQRSVWICDRYQQRCTKPLKPLKPLSSWQHNVQDGFQLQMVTIFGQKERIRAAG